MAVILDDVTTVSRVSGQLNDSVKQDGVQTNFVLQGCTLKNVISDDLETWERISQTLIFLRHGIGRAGVPGIVSGYLWFWRKTCAILRQLSPSDSFRFVLQVFLFYILFCYVFRSNVCYFGI